MSTNPEHNGRPHKEKRSNNDFLIEEIILHQGEVRSFCSGLDHLLMLTDGHVYLTYRELNNYEIRAGEMFVIPRSMPYLMKVPEGARFVIFCLSVGTHITDLLPLMTDESGSATGDCRFYTLTIRETVATFLDTVITCLEGGIEVVNYYEFKFRELLVLMRSFYTTDELVLLFCTILKPDPDFVSFVFHNYEKVKTVKELAEISHYSLSAFNRHFQKAFGIPPYVWMKHRKAMKLFNTIKNSNDTLQNISDDFDFSSLSQLSNFCKYNFGQTPTQIRRDRNMKSIKTETLR